MKKNKLTEFLGKADVFTKKNSPALLAGAAVVGVLTTVYCAWKAAPKADDILAKHKKEMETVKKGDKAAKRAVTKETAKELVPVVAPTILMAGATCAAIVGSQKINARRIAALSAAYTLSKDMVSDLNEQMLKDFGPKKANAVKDAVFEKKVKEEHTDDIPKRNDLMRKRGLYWCRDYLTGGLFMTNANIINTAITDISTRISSEEYITLGEFWDALESAGSIGMESIRRSAAKDLFGWTVDDLNRGRLDISYRAVLDDDDESPILALEYDARSEFRGRW